MWKNNNHKQKEPTKEVGKMKNILMICMVFVVVAFCATNAWASANPTTLIVNATIPAVTGGLTVNVSKVVGTVWTGGQTSIAFGNLVWHPENGTNGKPLNIFLPTMYYAVDVGVTDNSGTVWTVTHTRSSLVRTAGGNIDNKVNVSFSRVALVNGAEVESEFQKLSFGNSNNVGYTKTQLNGGWLRLYYGVGTGEAGKDAAGVTPIGLDTPSGTYAGSVTITLS
jgi:hypothetical protein